MIIVLVRMKLLLTMKTMKKIKTTMMGTRMKMNPRKSQKKRTKRN